MKTVWIIVVFVPQPNACFRVSDMITLSNVEEGEVGQETVFDDRSYYVVVYHIPSIIKRDEGQVKRARDVMEARSLGGDIGNTSSVELRVLRENCGVLQRTVFGKGRRKGAESTEEENEPK